MAFFHIKFLTSSFWKDAIMH